MLKRPNETQRERERSEPWDHFIVIFWVDQHRVFVEPKPPFFPRHSCLGLGGNAMMLAEAFVSGGLLNAALVHLRRPQEFR